MELATSDVDHPMVGPHTVVELRSVVGPCSMVGPGAVVGRSTMMRPLLVLIQIFILLLLSTLHPLTASVGPFVNRHHFRLKMD